MMAVRVHPRVVHMRRATITALPLYYSGHLLKKLKREKDFKRFYAELRGATLFLYQDDSQEMYTEKLDLVEFKALVLNSPRQRTAPTVLTLTLCTREVQLKMDNPDAGEEWRHYILTVSKREIPSKLRLLPGQLVQLEEVLAQEKRRNQPMPLPPLPPRPSFLRSASPSSPTPKDETDGIPGVPACFFNVTRKEAEWMLEANPGNGSIILRLSTLANSYALTLRQLTPSGPVMKNFRVTSTLSGFVIELDAPVRVPNLNGVLNYFIEKTEYRLHPYVSSHTYDTRIGESNTAVTDHLRLKCSPDSVGGYSTDVPLAPNHTGILSPTPKTVPKAQVAPMLRSNAKEEELQPPPTESDDEYVVPDDDHKVKLGKKECGVLRAALGLYKAST